MIYFDKYDTIWYDMIWYDMIWYVQRIPIVCIGIYSTVTVGAYQASSWWFTLAVALVIDEHRVASVETATQETKQNMCDICAKKKILE